MVVVFQTRESKITRMPGVTISIVAERHRGDRKNLEDYVAVTLRPNETLQKIPGMEEQAHVGLFDVPHTTESKGNHDMDMSILKKRVLSQCIIGQSCSL